MAEILKITTPLVNKNNQLQSNRPTPDPTTPFALQDIPTVARSAAQEEILKQNNGMIEKENSSNVLTSLLKDPAAAVGFLKNIFVLQEIVQLLPINNTTVTQEIEQMFQSLLIRPEDIAAEMIRQEGTSTVFRGELFTCLRGLLAKDASSDRKSGVVSLLKSINGFIGKQDAMNAVSNSLKYLSEALSPSRTLSEKLLSLSQRFRAADAEKYFPELKKEALSMLREIEGSLLFSPKMEKVNAITRYNLSRINSSADFFQEAVSNLMLQLDNPHRRELAACVKNFKLQAGALGEIQEKSKIMEVLTKIIGKQAGDSALTEATSEKIEKIICSLLSSPCHFTPLLHFVVPVEYDFLKSFAEIWINPNGEEDRRNSEETGGDCVHMLLVFDIQGIGQFEAEIFTSGKKLELLLFCPVIYRDVFAAAVGRFEKCIAQSSYQIKKVRVEALKRPRSLMEVFKSLPYKRTGVNVKI